MEKFTSQPLVFLLHLGTNLVFNCCKIKHFTMNKICEIKIANLQETPNTLLMLQYQLGFILIHLLLTGRSNSRANVMILGTPVFFIQYPEMTIDSSLILLMTTTCSICQVVYEVKQSPIHVQTMMYLALLCSKPPYRYHYKSWFPHSKAVEVEIYKNRIPVP